MNTLNETFNMNINIENCLLPISPKINISTVNKMYSEPNIQSNKEQQLSTFIQSNNQLSPIPDETSLNNLKKSTETKQKKIGRNVRRKRKKLKKSSPSMIKLLKILNCHICNCKFTSEVLLKRHIQSHTYQKPYKCDQCNESFNVIENLTLHISIHSQDQFRCPQCGKIFSRLASLEGHIKTHFKSEYFTCNLCSEMFHYEIKLKHHLLAAHPNEKFQKQLEREARTEKRRLRKGKENQCAVCGKIFEKNFLLERHERIHRNEKPYKCHLCSQSFTQKYSLVIHQSTHNGTKPYQCPHCDQACSQKGNLLVHIQRCHSMTESSDKKESLHVCSQCSCSFKYKRTLNAHISRCHPIGTDSITDLDFDFNVNHVIEQLSELNRPNLLQIDDDPGIVETNEDTFKHSTSNTEKLSSDQPTITTKSNKSDDSVTFIQITDDKAEDSPVQYVIERRFNGISHYLICPYCKKTFNRRADIIRHIRIHSNSKPFECEICKRKFRVKATLTTHMLIHATDSHLRYPCPICFRRLKSAKSLDAHGKKYHSDHVPAVIKLASDSEKLVLGNSGNEEELDREDEFNENKQFKCDYCNKCFSSKDYLRQHINGHLDNKIYQCSKCLKCFGKASVLSRHLQSHLDAKSHSCNICSYTCITADKLKRHAQSHCIANVTCPLCNGTYKNQFYLKLHMKKHRQAHELQMQNISNIESVNLIDEHSESLPSSALSPITDSLELEEPLLANGIVHIDQEIPVQIIDSTSAFDTNVIVSQPLIIQDETGSEQFNPNECWIILAPQDQQLIQFTEETDENTVIFHQIDSQLTQSIEPITQQANIIEHFQSNQINDNSTITDNIPDNKPNVSLETQIIKEKIKSILNNKKPLIIPKNQTPRNHPCNQCLKSFQKPIDLRRHMRTHTGERPFECSICSKSFSLRCTLNIHQKTHLANKPAFPCHICAKKFANKNSLQVHMRIHAGLRPYKCEFCPLSFRTHGHRNHHMMAHLREAIRKNVEPNAVKTRMEKGRIKQLMNAADLINNSIE